VSTNDEDTAAMVTDRSAATDLVHAIAREVRSTAPGCEAGDLYTLGAGTDPRDTSVKDRLELRLLALVCQGKLPLAQAQHAITTDWVVAYRTYVGPVG